MTYHQLIEGHYTRHWGPVSERVAVRQDRSLSAAFRVLVIHCREDATAYATCGMSRANEEYRLELFLLVRRGCHPGPPPGSGTCGVIDLLAAVADYHVAGAQLGLHHTVNFGQPFLPGSSCTHGYLSLPYLDGPELEWMDEPEVRFLWLIPITARELEFKKQHGAEALEQRFEEAQFDYLDPRRPSVV